MQFYQGSVRRKPEPKKIPIGRFVLLALLLIFIWKKCQPAKEEVKTKKAEKQEVSSSSPSKKKSAAIQSSSSKAPPEIAYFRWKDEQGMMAERIEFHPLEIQWNSLLQFKKITEEQKELALWAFQRCGEEHPMKVRFFTKKQMNRWSFECAGTKREFRRKKQGPWVDEEGCPKGDFCWVSPLRSFEQLRDSLEKEVFIAEAKYRQEVKNVVGGRVMKFDSSPKGSLVLRTSSGTKIHYQGEVKWGHSFAPGEKLARGQVLGSIEKGNSLRVSIFEGMDLLSLKNLVNHSNPYRESLWKEEVSHDQSTP